MTTLEVTNLGRFGFMGGRGGTSLQGQQAHQHQGEEGASGGHKHAHGKSGFFMNLLGLDKYTKGKAADGLVRAAKVKNPFDLGVVGNCKDFWTSGRELGVDYELVRFPSFPFPSLIVILMCDFNSYTMFHLKDSKKPKSAVSETKKKKDLVLPLGLWDINVQDPLVRLDAVWGGLLDWSWAIHRVGGLEGVEGEGMNHLI